MAKLTVNDCDFKGKKVLIRVDFNVPINKETGEVSDDTRIVAALPTIKYVIENGGKAILVSHLGRPKGEKKPEFSLEPVSKILEKLIGRKVFFADDCIGEEVENKVSKMKNGDILLLQNVRYYKEEKKNTEDFAKKLAKLADIHVNDAFGTAHRAHASNVGVANYLKSAAGFLMEKEIKMLGKAVENPDHPYVVILGGAKVSDKIGVITNLLTKADKILIGGAMMFTFLKAMGKEVGNSLVEAEKIDLAKDILQKAKENKVDFVLPVDTLVAKEIKAGVEVKVVKIEDGVPEGWMGLDIGPETINLFSKKLEDAKTVVWNGPMGVFEIEDFSKGTSEIAKKLAELKDAVTIIGGGDSAAAIKKFKLENEVSHVSTGGGASLEMLEGKELPGIKSISELTENKSRGIIIAGNWKMNKTPSESKQFANVLAGSVGNEKEIEVIVFPSALSLDGVSEILKDTTIEVGIQNIYPKDSGAFTGENAIPMAKDLGLEFVLVGHSERRHVFGEKDDFLNTKVKAVLEAGLKPMFCIGELLEDRESESTNSVLETQIKEGLKDITKDQMKEIVVAYEPVWAIGTGVVATPEQAEETMAFCRKVLEDIFGCETAENTKILYGGSIKPNNFDSLISQKNIDGGLIGGASLNESFIELIEIAKKYI